MDVAGFPFGGRLGEFGFLPVRCPESIFFQVSSFILNADPDPGKGREVLAGRLGSRYTAADCSRAMDKLPESRLRILPIRACRAAETSMIYK